MRILLSQDNQSHQLTLDDENELLSQAKQGNLHARNELITSHVPFLLNMSQRFKPYHLDAEDMFGDAVIGFIDAIDKAKLPSFQRFTHQAYNPVRDALLLSDSHMTTVNLPYHTRRRCRKVQQAELRLFVDTGKVTISQVANEIGWSDKAVELSKQHEQFMSVLSSLDSVDVETGTAYIERVVCPSSNDGFDRIMVETDLEYFLSKLSKQERYVVERRSGIPTEMNNSELAAILKTSKASVSRMYTGAMQKMQTLAKALQGTAEQIRMATQYPEVVMAGI